MNKNEYLKSSIEGMQAGLCLGMIQSTSRMITVIDKMMENKEIRFPEKEDYSVRAEVVIKYIKVHPE